MNRQGRQQERQLDNERSDDWMKGDLENTLLSLKLSGSNELFYCASRYGFYTEGNLFYNT